MGRKNYIFRQDPFNISFFNFSYHGDSLEFGESNYVIESAIHTSNGIVEDLSTISHSEITIRFVIKDVNFNINFNQKDRHNNTVETYNGPMKIDSVDIRCKTTFTAENTPCNCSVKLGDVEFPDYRYPSVQLRGARAASQPIDVVITDNGKMLGKHLSSIISCASRGAIVRDWIGHFPTVNLDNSRNMTFEVKHVNTSESNSEMSVACKVYGTVQKKHEIVFSETKCPESSGFDYLVIKIRPEFFWQYFNYEIEY